MLEKPMIFERRELIKSIFMFISFQQRWFRRKMRIHEIKNTDFKKTNLWAPHWGIEGEPASEKFKDIS